MDCPYIFTKGRNGGSDSFTGTAFEPALKQTQAVLQNFYCWGKQKHNTMIFHLTVCVASLYLAVSYRIAHMPKRGSQGLSFRVNLWVYMGWKLTFKGSFQGWIQAGWGNLNSRLRQRDFCFILKDVGEHKMSKCVYHIAPFFLLDCC